MLLGNPPKLPCYYYYYYTTTLQHHPPFTLSHFEAKNGVKTMQCILKFWSDIFETNSTNFSTILQIKQIVQKYEKFFLVSVKPKPQFKRRIVSFFSENYAKISPQITYKPLWKFIFSMISLNRQETDNSNGVCLLHAPIEAGEFIHLSIFMCVAHLRLEMGE